MAKFEGNTIRALDIGIIKILKITILYQYVSISVTIEY